MPTTALLLVAAIVLTASARAAPPDELLTIAESSGYEATSTYDEVIAFIDALEARSTILRRLELGRTVEDRSIPLLIIADPPIDTAAAARASGKTIVFAFGNIHAGEVCGKEGLLMLARELALPPRAPVLDEVIVVLAPIFNADGNQPMAPGNRPGQVGPAQGMGVRPNAQGLDLNRDYVKLASPEVRALAGFLTEWDPHLTIDTHTTNGSHHRYTLTWDVPLNPSGPAAPVAYLRNELLPEVTERLRERTGYETFYYGNFDRFHTRWTTYSAQPRFGGPYQGLRGQMSILSEAYSYAPYRDRVLCTLGFVSEIVEYAARHGDAIRAVHDAARVEITEAGRNPQPDDVVGIRHRPAPFARTVSVKGYEEEADESGRRQPTEVERDYEVVHMGRFEATRSVARPWAYVIPSGLEHIVVKLDQHGIEIRPFAGRARVERYRVDSIARRQRPFQGHRLVMVEATASTGTTTVPEGAYLVPTAQPLGTLAVYLLEPESEDGLVAWGFFDDHIAEGEVFPVLRIRAAVDVPEAMRK